MIPISFFAPGVVDYFEEVGVARREPGPYADLWRRAAAHLPDVVAAISRARATDPAAPASTVEIRRMDVRDRFNRFRTIDQDALERPVEVLVLRIPAHLITVGAGSGPRLRDEVTCRLYDHGVFVIEGGSDCAADLARGVGVALDSAQDAVIDLTAAVAREVHDRWLVPLVRELRGLDEGGRVVCGELSRVGRQGHDYGSVLWVTRGLVVDARRSRAVEMAHHWVKDVVGDGDVVDRLLAARRPGCVVRWFNHLFVVQDDRRSPAEFAEFAATWEAMRYGQYFWAALEELDRDLTSVFAHSMTHTSTTSLRSMRASLEECAHRAEFALIDLTEMRKSLTRSVQDELSSLLEFWDFEGAIRDSVAHKIAACERRLGELSEVRARRSDYFTDLILLAIGVTSILGTMLAFSEFGRVMAGDPDMAGFDLTDNGLTTWIAAQPADLLMLGAGVVSASLVLVYLYFRRSRDL